MYQMLHIHVSNIHIANWGLIVKGCISTDEAKTIELVDDRENDEKKVIQELR